jgi:hypothetical protein
MTNHHPGNKRFRDIVNKCKPDYVRTDRGKKATFAMQILQEIQSHSGRFLQRNPPLNNHWYDIGKVRSIAKICQALREAAPALRGVPKRDRLKRTLPQQTSVLRVHYPHAEQQPPPIQLGKYQHNANTIEPSQPQPALSTCVPLPRPTPSYFQGNLQEESKKALPDFMLLANFPNIPGQCTMCGLARPPKKPKPSGPNIPSIPAQNKGVCTSCDVKVWIIMNDGNSGMKNAKNTQIKWCKGCKNFRPWASFGVKGRATKCTSCRELQAERYKELKQKQKEPVGKET